MQKKAKISKKSSEVKISGGGISIDISLQSILVFLLVIGGIIFAYQIRTVLFIVFMAFVLMSAFRPVVMRLVAGRISKPWAIMIVYVVVLVLFFTVVTLISVPILEDFALFIQDMPQIIANISSKITVLSKFLTFFAFDPTTQNWGNAMRSAFSVGNIQSAISSLFGAIGVLISLISIVILSIYLLAQRDQVLDYFSKFFSNKDHSRLFKKLFLMIEQQVGLWFRGWIIYTIIIGTVMFIALSIIGVPFALPLSVLSGMLEAIPLIGPFIALSAIFLIAVSTGSVVKIILVLITYIAVQSLAVNYVMPQVMKRVVGLNPLVTISAVLVGAQLDGFYGALIAVPVVVIVQVVFNFWANEIQRRNIEAELDSKAK